MEGNLGSVLLCRPSALFKSVFGYPSIQDGRGNPPVWPVAPAGPYKQLVEAYSGIKILGNVYAWPRHGKQMRRSTFCLPTFQRQPRYPRRMEVTLQNSPFLVLGCFQTSESYLRLL